MDASAWIAGVALVLASGTTATQIVAVRRSYLVPSLAIQRPSPRVANIAVSISNSSSMVRSLGPVFLLVGPIAEDPVTTFNRILSTVAGQDLTCCALDFEFRVGRTRLTSSGDTLRCIIPLSYFTEENDSIGNETLSFTYPLTLPSSAVDLALAVRLYVYGQRRWRHRLHRKIEETIVLTGTEQQTDFGLTQAAEPPNRGICGIHRGCRSTG